MKRTAISRSTSFHAQLGLSREERVEARAKRMANLAEIQRAAPPTVRGVIERVVGAAPGQPKENVSQSEAYMAAVRALGYCMRCGCTLKKGEGQFCHADQGKGMGLKTDVRRGWLGCAGCHFHVGTSGRMPRAERRAEESRLAAKTRELVMRAGTWPKNLPQWSEL